MSKNFQLLSITIALTVLSTANCRLFEAPAPLKGPVVPAKVHVDLQRYMGTWYGIASIPLPFGGDCVCGLSKYTLEKGNKVRVYNECQNKAGKKRSVIGFAVSRNADNTELSVFIYGNQAPYWILDIGDSQNYGYVLVGEPSRKSLFILARTRTITDAVYKKLTDKAVELGYDPKTLVKSQPQYCEKASAMDAVAFE